MIKICVTDDHALVRRGLKQIFDDTKDIRVVDEASTGEELMMKAQTRSWNAILMDLTMPGQGGLETLRQIRARFPRQPVIILTMHSEEQYAVRAIKDGAAGYLTKDCKPETLIAAVRTVASGARYITPELANQLAVEVGDNRSRLPHESLSSREDQVFRLLAEGKTVTQIASEFSLSAKTISTNRARILRKTGLRNNAEIVYYAHKHKLVEAPVGV